MPIGKYAYKGFVNICDQSNNAVIQYFGQQNSKLKAVFTSASQSCCLFLFLRRVAYWKNSEVEKNSNSLNFLAVTTYLHQLRNNWVLCNHSVSQKNPCFLSAYRTWEHNCSCFIPPCPKMLKTYDSTVDLWYL